MIKLRKLIIVSFTLTSIYFLNGCSDDEPASVPFELLSMDEKRTYMKNEYKPIAQALTAMANDPEFRSILYQEIEKKFDGDYNVLIENLVNLKTASGKTLRERMESNIGDGVIDKALDKFRNLEGEDWYPQIFIPSFDLLKEKQVIQGRNQGVFQVVPIIFYDGDETKIVVNGYLPDENGELVESVFGIDEQYAMENEVWIISINESGITPGQVVDVKANSSTGRTAVSDPAVIEHMKIKCGHESWIAGASEVNTVAYFAAYNWSTYNSVELFGGGSNEGGKINEFSRATVEAENWVSVDFDLNFYWDGRPSTATYIDIIIFEYDAWPTGTKEKQWTHADGTPIFFVYRSADTNYSTNTILKSDFATTRVTKNCIEWTGIL